MNVSSESNRGITSSCKPLHQDSDVTELLNRSKLVESWLLCNECKKLKFHILLKIISMYLKFQLDALRKQCKNGMKSVLFSKTYHNTENYCLTKRREN